MHKAKKSRKESESEDSSSSSSSDSSSSSSSSSESSSSESESEAESIQKKRKQMKLKSGDKQPAGKDSKSKINSSPSRESVVRRETERSVVERNVRTERYGSIEERSRRRSADRREKSAEIVDKSLNRRDIITDNMQHISMDRHIRDKDRNRDTRESRDGHGSRERHASRERHVSRERQASRERHVSRERHCSRDRGRQREVGAWGSSKGNGRRTNFQQNSRNYGGHFREPRYDNRDDRERYTERYNRFGQHDDWDSRGHHNDRREEPRHDQRDDRERYTERYNRTGQHDDYDSRSHQNDRRERSRSRSLKRERVDNRERRHLPDQRPPQRQRRRHNSNSDTKTYEWGKPSDNDKDKKEPSPDPADKEKPNFALSGALAEDTNKVNGVVVKYAEPPEARKPKRRWRLYPFKGETALPTLHIHRQSCFLVGRDRKVVDLAVDHPSCSKQHAALQYRLVSFAREDGTMGKRVRLYLIDLDSANGTFLNNKQIEARKYYELIEKDVIKFGFSTREYVLLHENSKEDQEDDDVDVKVAPEENSTAAN